MEDWSGDPAHRQRDARLRCEWGMRGAEAIASGADVAIVVDVLSFTTTLSVALDAGMTVLPYQWRDNSAQDYAEEHDAILATGRVEQEPGQISLSPGSIRRAAPCAGSRLVLPSPNGSTISFHLATAVPVVIGASLRNATAVARWVAETFPSERTIVAVIPAGERWADGSLRPAVEDLWGAGAVLDALFRMGWTDCSPEALVARDAFACIRAADVDVLTDWLRTCASGRELIERGYGEDVEIAAEYGASESVPVLHDRAFVNAES